MFDLRAVAAAHRMVVRETDVALDKALDAAGDYAEWHVTAHARFRHRTGAVKGGTRHRVTHGLGSRRLTIMNLARHARWLEEGTRPHLIVARRRRSLAFFWIRIGRQMVLKSVRHPGTKPYWFLKDATSAAGLRFAVLMGRSMDRIAARF